MREGCSANIWRGFHSYPCKAKPSVEREGEKFCAMHDPVRRQKQRDEVDADRKAMFERREKTFRLESQAQPMADLLKRILEKAKWDADTILALGEQQDIEAVLKKAGVL